MVDLVKCSALKAFSVFVTGYGVVLGDPDSSLDAAKSPDVPARAVAELVDAGLVELTGGKKAKPGTEPTTDTAP